MELTIKFTITQISFRFHLHREQISSSDDENDVDNDVLQPFEEQSLYLVNGKFAANADGSLELSVTSNQSLEIDIEDVP
jgi:hypothetical protein